MKMSDAGGDKVAMIEEILLDPPDRRARLGGSEDPANYLQIAFYAGVPPLQNSASPPIIFSDGVVAERSSAPAPGDARFVAEDVLCQPPG
jgi:hypothetical protein